MKTEFLKSLNLSQEVIDKIMAENGKDIAAEQKKADKIIQDVFRHGKVVGNVETAAVVKRCQCRNPEV